MADEPTVDNDTTTAESGEAPAKKTATRKSAAKKATAKRTTTKKAPATGTETAGTETTGSETTGSAAAKKTPAKRTTAKRTTKKAAATQETVPGADAEAPATEPEAPATEPEAPATEPDTAATEPDTAATEPDTAATEPDTAAESATDAPAKKTTTRKTTAKKTAAKKTTAKKAAAKKTTAKKTTAKRTTKKAADAPAEPAEAVAPAESAEPAESREAAAVQPQSEQAAAEAESAAPAVLFQAPDAAKATPRKRTSRRKAATETPTEEAGEQAAPESAVPTEAAVEQPAPAGAGGRSESQTEDASEGQPEDDTEDKTGDEAQESGSGRRRRRRGGRRRRKSGGDNEATGADNDADNANGAESDADDEDKAGAEAQGDTSEGDEQAEGGGSSRRRRRRRRSGESGGDNGDDADNTATKVRSGRSAEDQITALSGSTRLEAKKQRRREGREAGRRRAPIVSEAEFLARRESVDRVMVIRQRDDLTQIGVLEDKVLVEHYVARESQTSLIGNVYLGRVQNVLPSMEAAFIDIGKGRNAVLYAGEVNWSALGWKEGQPRKIESVLTSGQKVLVQVTKDPIGHKGARLTSQISLAGRFLVYVPDGTTSGISRKLPDTERNRLKTLLKEIVPDSAGVIVRTAAEGASEDELTADVERLKARWDDIEKRAGGNAPQLLYGEPDLTLKVVRDLFTEDFSKLVIQGDDAWETVRNYVASVAPDLEDRLEKYDGAKDAFAAYRIDEQIAKGLDRKVWLPSGGSLIIDRTEAMTVVDVNTGKFTGSGGNLEETVTKNNLEAAEEIVRQLRLRDIGGIIVVDFIDMVLESNRDLVLRRLVECLGRDRTRHQVAEVTSLGLVQMTRKRIGTGLLEAFSETCEHCAGRGLVIHDHPVEPGKSSGIAADEPRGRRRRGRGKGGNDESRPAQGGTPTAESPKPPTPAEFAAMAAKAEKAENGERSESDEQPAQSTQPTQSTQSTQPAQTGEATESTGSERPEQPEQPAEPTGSDQADQPDQQAPSAPDEQAAKTARKRPARGRSAKSGKTPVDAPVAAEAAVTPLEPVAMEQPPVDPLVASPSSDVAASDGSPSDAASTDAEPEKPKVVTRTRRRAASRPAGSPAQVSEVQPVVVESPAVVPTPAPVAAPEPPKVITRTRRGASRPAGATATDDSAGAALVADPAPGEGTEEPHVEHVPVKKKGARKR